MALRTAIYVLVGLALMLYWNFDALQTYFQTRAKLERYRESTAALRQEHDRLLKENAALQDRGFDMEKAIRERLLMVRPGEHILFIEPTPSPSPEATPLPSAP